MFPHNLTGLCLHWSISNNKRLICLNVTVIALSEVRFLDMMSQCFPDNLALIASAFELPFCFSMIVGFEMGGWIYEMLGFWAPLNMTGKF